MSGTSRRHRLKPTTSSSTTPSRVEGWFFPSTFLYRLDTKYGGGLLSPPWYSGLTQGSAAAFFARLWRVNGDGRYREAAEHSLESFLVRAQAWGPVDE